MGRRTKPARVPAVCQLPEINESTRNRVDGMIRGYRAGEELELEASFGGVTQTGYERIGKGYLSWCEEVSTSTMLDISINLEGMRSYRVSIQTAAAAQEFIDQHLHQTTANIRKLAASMTASETVQIYLKSRVQDGVQDLTDLGVRWKMATETPADGRPPNLRGTETVVFRLKNRGSFQINPAIRLDLTQVRTGKTMAELSQSPVTYEAELELTAATEPEPVWDEVCRVLQYLQDSDSVITVSRSKEVLRQLTVLMGEPRSGLRQPVSITPEATVNLVPSRYGVTDKADGERHQLYLAPEGVYLVNSNLVVRDTGLTVSDRLHQTVLDGEVIKLTDGEGRLRRVFLAFDVIYHRGIDYRHETRYGLQDRVAILEEIIDTGFQTLVSYPDYAESGGEMTLAAVEKYHRRQLPKYCRRWRRTLDQSTGLCVLRKLYLTPYGIGPPEVFLLSTAIWDTYQAEGGMPYLLDGLIMTPLGGGYLTGSRADGSRGQAEYKWKPPKLNTIDFWITYQKDDRGGDRVYYEEGGLTGTSLPYKIAQLHIGETRDHSETPVPFRIDGVPQVARHRFGEDGLVRSEEGDVIHDQTVVEYYYLLEGDLESMDRWVPLRVRHDKTHTVRSSGRKYGNAARVARAIWHTIAHPVTEDHLRSLSSEETYAEQAALLLADATTRPRPAKPYYQVKTRLAEGARAFNNQIKSDLIGNYAQGQRVLDVGCGRGGDLGKFNRAGITEYVGLDPDAAGMFLIRDSAISRARRLSRQGASWRAQFVQADATVPWNSEAQLRALPHMRAENGAAIDRYLSGQFGVVSAQFTVHYYPSDAESWANWCANLRQVMAPGAYLLLTCFDGELVARELAKTNPVTVDYVDEGGVRHKFYEIRKMYPDHRPPGPGLAIDFYNSLISEEGVYHREYLIHPEWLIQSLKEECGLRLVETNSFYNMFHLYRGYYEGGLPETDRGGRRIASFYSSLDPEAPDYSSALAGYKLSMLNRYYVFQNSELPCAAPVLSRLAPVLEVAPLREYFREHELYLDGGAGASESSTHYGEVRRQTGVRPDVYLLHHRQGVLSLTSVKQNGGRYSIILYKSPDRTYYPIYHRTEDGGREHLLRTRGVITALGRRVALETMRARHASRSQ